MFLAIGLWLISMCKHMHMALDSSWAAKESKVCHIVPAETMECVVVWAHCRWLIHAPIPNHMHNFTNTPSHNTNEQNDLLLIVVLRAHTASHHSPTV